MTMRTGKPSPRRRFSHPTGGRRPQSKLGLGNEAYRWYFHHRNLSLQLSSLEWTLHNCTRSHQGWVDMVAVSRLEEV